MEITQGKVIPVEIHQEVKNSFLDYAMSVIVSRALPDVRDGLKPVNRRILYSMFELGMFPDKPYKKSARLVGEVLGKYHPHGEQAVYDAMVRLAQDFNSRYPLVDGHGNFGSIDGDAPAAMRYTEVRLAPIAMEMLADINKDTIDFRPNFDETLSEPVVLPSRFPNLLVNGSSGIAVGMATNIPPHNLGEIIDALFLLIDEPEVEINKLLEIIKGPDFPTGGEILGLEGIRTAYRTGRGTIKTRGKARIERNKSGKTNIVIFELPYQVNKAKLIERIAELVRDKKIDGITDLRDESDREGIRIVLEIKKGAVPRVILNKLYKFTPLEQNFGIIMLALVDNKPRVLNIKEVLKAYLEHQKEVITRRTAFDLDKAEKRAHILEGLRIALKNLDAVIKLIRSSRTTEAAKQGLMERFSLTERQAQAILDMRLQKLTGLEQEKLEEEYLELIQNIAYFMEVLANERLVYQIIKKELQVIKDKHGDARRTVIVPQDEELEIEDLIAEESVVITLTNQGNIKRYPLSGYRSQQRGGKGITGMATRKDDFVESLFIATTHHTLLCFSNKGKVYHLKVYEIPQSGRNTMGINIVNLLSLNEGEVINAVIPIKNFEENRFLILGTSRGYVKKTALKEFTTPRRGGLIAINLPEGDELIGVKKTRGDDEIFLVTEKGMAIRFSEEEVRPMGRAARGVIGIRLNEGDRVIGMDLASQGEEVLLVTAGGFGKRTKAEQFKRQRRGGRGLMALKITENKGNLAGFKMVRSGEDIMLVTSKGLIIRQAVTGITLASRYAQGVTVIKLAPEDRVVGIGRVLREEK